MRQPLLSLLGATAVLALAGGAFARSADGDGKETVESRLLRILKDRGVLSEAEFGELSQLAARMRAEESVTSVALERDIAELSAKLTAQATQKKDEGPTLGYRFGKGLSVSKGDDFSMTIGGRFQPRFTYLAPDGPTNEAAAVGGTPKNDDRATFEVRRARVNIEGNVLGKDTTYKFQFDVAAAASPLRDAYIDHRFSDELHVRGGQMKRPFSRSNWISSGNLQFVDRSAVNDRFRSVAGGDRGVGAMVWGELAEKTLEWYLEVDNGEASNNGNPNTVDLGGGVVGGSFLPSNSANDDSSGLQVVARLAYNPWGPVGYTEADVERTADPKLGFGIGYMYTPERRGNPLALSAGDLAGGLRPDYLVQTFGADLAFRHMGFYAQLEGFFRTIQASGQLEDAAGHFLHATETGYYAQGGYFFGSSKKGEGPEVAVRYSQIDFDQSIAPAETALATTKVDDYTAAFSYYFEGHALKLQADYTYRVRNLKAQDIDDEDQIFRLQAQVMF